MVKNEEDVYRVLQKHLDKMPIGFPATKSGVELRLLKYLFTPESIRLIYEYSQGYPRKIAVLCHNALEELIMQRKERVDENIISEVIKREDI